MSILRSDKYYAWLASFSSNSLVLPIFDPSGIFHSNIYFEQKNSTSITNHHWFPIPEGLPVCRKRIDRSSRANYARNPCGVFLWLEWCGRDQCEIILCGWIIHALKSMGSLRAINVFHLVNLICGSPCWSHTASSNIWSLWDQARNCLYGWRQFESRFKWNHPCYQSEGSWLSMNNYFCWTLELKLIASWLLVPNPGGIACL